MKTLLITICILATATLNAQNFQWAKAFGGLGNDVGNSIAVDTFGNVYTTGSFKDTVDFDPGPGTTNLISAGSGYGVFVQKMDPSGHFLWAKAFGGNGYGGNSIVIDAVGNIYTTGYFAGTVDFDPRAGIANLVSNGGFDIFVQKMDASGNFLWAKSFGGYKRVEGYSIAVDASGNVYTTGLFSDTADFDPGAGIYNLGSNGLYDIFVQKMDPSGNFLWAKAFGSPFRAQGNSIATDASGNVYTTGNFFGTVDFDPGAGIANLTAVGGRDIFVQKMDASGNFLWAKAFGGSGVDYGVSITVDASGNVYTTGRFESTVDFDPGAGIANLISAGSSDIFVQKLDATGNLLWAKSFGGFAFDVGNSIAVDASGNVYTAGSFQLTVDFDPGPGIANLISAGVSDIFIQKMDASGNFLWAKAFGGYGYDGGTSLAVDALGHVYTTGYFGNTVDFDPGAGTANLSSAGTYDVFVHKMSQTTVGIIEHSVEDEIEIYPNPSPSYFSIDLGETLSEVKISIRDVNGKLVDAYEYNKAQRLNLDFDAPAGIYFLSLESKEQRAVFRLVKQ
ncbi:MAG: SBBP repeat-containing protein [Vicingaceae bacterium]